MGKIKVTLSRARQSGVLRGDRCCGGDVERIGERGDSIGGQGVKMTERIEHAVNVATVVSIVLLLAAMAAASFDQ